MKTTAAKTQLQLNMRLPRERRKNKCVTRTRAQWWFARMRQVVLAAPSQPQQAKLILSA